MDGAICWWRDLAAISVRTITSLVIIYTQETWRALLSPPQILCNLKYALWTFELPLKEKKKKFNMNTHVLVLSLFLLIDQHKTGITK